MTRRIGIIVTVCVLACASSALVLNAQDKKETEVRERKIKESEVPAAAVVALKKLAGSAVITGYEEEFRQGDKLYEGAWKIPAGKVHALVTPGGELVILEETVLSEQLPAGVQAVVKKEAGAGAESRFERVTTTRYEAKYKKDGHWLEIIMSPTGRIVKPED